MNHDDPRPLAGPGGDAPEALRRALRALGREQPSQAAMSAAALRLEATLDHARLAPAPASRGSKLAPKLFVGALAAALATLALRPAPQAEVRRVELATMAAPDTQVTPSERDREEVPASVTAEPTRAAPAAPPALESRPRRHEQPATLRARAAVVATVFEPQAPRSRAEERALPEPHAFNLAPESAPVSSAPAVAPPLVQVRSSPDRQVSITSAPRREERVEPGPNAELGLLLEARKHARDDPEATLRATTEHARLYPAGALAPEREVLAIRALRALGRSGEAAQRVARFRAAYPASVHLSGLEQH